MNLALFGGATPQELQCSRAGCRRDATRALRWRNPKIHSEDRQKTWLACDEHLDVLREFLAQRDFPLTVVTIDTLTGREHSADDET